MKPAQLCFFFFQAEDGIRDIGVTGVQTCALPISSAAPPAAPARSRRRGRARAPLEERRRRLAWVQKNNRPQTTAPPCEARAGLSEWRAERLHSDDVRRVKPLLAGFHLELDDLSFRQRLEAVHLDRREVDEHVLAALLLNEAVPFGVIEPLHLSLCHSICLLRSRTLGLNNLPGTGVGRDRFAVGRKRCQYSDTGAECRDGAPAKLTTAQLVEIPYKA